MSNPARLGRVSFLASLLLLVTVAHAADPAPAPKPEPPGLRLVHAAMQNREFEAAAGLAEQYAKADHKDNDEAVYLQALALQYAGKHEPALAAADALIKQFPKSVWLDKAFFLKVRSLIALRRFEPAQQVLDDEAHRLLAPARKQQIASVLVEFADALATVPDVNDPGAPPADFNKAHNLYAKTLEMEISRELRDEVMYKAALASQKANNHPQALNEFRAYLDEFDPAWLGSPDSARRRANQQRLAPVLPGVHIYDSRYHLAVSMLAVGQTVFARQELEDLLTLAAQNPAAKQDPKLAELRADAQYQIVRTFQMPSTPPQDLERAVKAARDFLAAYADNPRSVEVAFLVAQTYQQHGRADDAVAAYTEFFAGKNFKLPVGPLRSKVLDEFHKSPEQLFDLWQKQALYTIGEVRYSQKQYAAAIEAWQKYVTQFTSGPQWAAAQHRIIDAEFQVALESISQKKYDAARKLLDQFLAAHPLDERAPQVMFVLGQMFVAEAEKLAEKDKDNPKPDRAPVNKLYEAAIAAWAQLISKYPGSAPASLALYQTAMLYEEKLGDLEKALEAYRRVTFGSWAGPARQRLAVMTQKHLALCTDRKFRSTETPLVKLNVRNIEKVTVRQYFLDLEAYFRKTHAAGGVEALDISLIQPDKTFEVAVKDYAKYKPLEQTIEIPFEGKKPGVCIVNVSEEDFEATTLVIRSDIDTVFRASRAELLAYAQDMVENKPAKGVTVLVSDGAKVFATGVTGDDGVFRKKFDELKTAESVRLFAVRNGHVAADPIALDGLSLSSGLSRKGYIYTDRPAYQPGHTVSVRGVIRDVKDGSYRSPAGDVYTVSVSDSRGRMLRQEDLKLSEFGSFHTQFALDPAAAVGNYTITAQLKDKPEITYSGTFTVQQFQLEKIKAALDFPRRVYFRGEKINATLHAEYYWGQPLADRSVRIQLPDGRAIVQNTDEKGDVKFEFDTTGMPSPSALRFSAAVEGENVATTGVVQIAALGFQVALDRSQETILAGESVGLTVKTTTPDGKPTGQDVIVHVLRREVVVADPVLSKIPWVPRPTAQSAEVTVQEVKASTDAKTGKATVQIKLEKSGEYVLRVTGLDRADQVVTGETTVNVSGDDDETKLRIFADEDTLKVGQEAKARLHSRLEKSLALITYEGESILAHQVVPIAKGFNDLAIKIGHEHFPNFTVAVSVMDGRDLRTAEHEFTVQRELKLAIKPLKDIYAPGAPGEVEVTATDQLGKPVAAEFSLAMVDEALHALFGDPAPPIGDFFNEGTQRESEFRVAATNGFRYDGVTRAVNKTIEQEGERLALQVDELKKLDEAQDQAKAQSAVFEPNAPAATPAPMPAKPGADKDTAGQGGGAGGRAEGRKNAGLFGVAASGAAVPEETARQLGEADGLSKKRDGTAATPRRELPDAGFWVPDVVTNKEGKATVKITMPEKTTQWRLTARGVTVETLAGQAEAKLVTREDFFVEVKLPMELTEGDAIRPVVRLHNLSDFEGPVEVKFRVVGPGGALVQQSHTGAAKKKQTTELVLDPVKVPAVPGAEGLEFIVEAQAGEMSDAVSRRVPVRAWGMEYAANGGGVAEGDVTIPLELPADLPYSSRRLTVVIGPDLKRDVIEMALRGPDIYYPVWLANGKDAIARIMPPFPIGNVTGSELLAAASGLEYARAVNAPIADQQRLVDRVRTLVASLVTQQRDDGGWGWNGGNSDTAVSALSDWALARADALGVKVADASLANAEKFLREALKRTSGTDYDSKAMVLHALSQRGAADYELVNPLHRQRNSLSAAALAYTALTLVNLDRKPMAAEIVELLETKIKSGDVGERKVAWWAVDGAQQAWLTDQVETTAAVVLAMMKVKPASPSIPRSVDWLMQERGCLGTRPPKAHGPVVAALAEYFRNGQFADTDFKLNVSVNDAPLKTIEHRAGESPLAIEAAPETLKEGRNTVRITMQGRGKYSYAATLRGFSAQFKDPMSWDHPRIESRRYYHAPLEYRGRPIGPTSTSSVKNLEVGQRTQVYVDLTNTATGSYLVIEEPLPAGTTLVSGSLQGSFTHYEVVGGRIFMYFPPGKQVEDVRYELVGYSSGTFRAMPTVIRDVMRPDRMRIGGPSELAVLTPGEKSADEYVINDSERLAFGTALFEDGAYESAMKQLVPLFDRKQKYAEREVARMLLWIRTTEKYYDAKQAVEAFEVLTERYPELTIPFDKILVVGRAYKDIGEFERAALVYRATIDSSFLRDSLVSAILQDEGQTLGSIDYQQDLGWEYPDTPAVVSSHFALSQQLYQVAPKAAELAKAMRKMKRRIRVPGQDAKAQKEAPTRIELLVEAIKMLDRFLVLYPNDPLADDAAFSMTNAFLDLKDYKSVVTLSQKFKERYGDSSFVTSFQYMTALGHFWQRDYEPALAAAKVVADGQSKDRDLARYILGQIQHARGNPAEAIRWYETVKTQFSDAEEAIGYFERKAVSLEEVTRFKPGDPVKLALKYRNIAAANLQVYKVDLMKLYLREKNLSGITRVNLAGIQPQAVMDVKLGDGKDYVDKTRDIELKLDGEGAYLVICRGEDLFASGLVLVSPLKLEVQEEAESGRVRANVIDEVTGLRPAGVHVKAIGSADTSAAGIKSGETDLRGVFIGDGLRGVVTVIARDQESRYAFYRGKNWVGAPMPMPQIVQQKLEQAAQPASKANAQVDYQSNLRMDNGQLQQMNYNSFDQLRRSGGKGVQVQQAK
jgi:uncharacterized protein YfaS (alpha-2-macroglobulin family)/tetratricopeptide (TPR) repeat protein